MRNKINAIGVAALLAMLVFTPGMTCQKSPKQITYNTLASVGYTTDAALKSYLDLVARGDVPTTALPKVTERYTTFQAIYSLALNAAQMNPNTVAGADVIAASVTVINEIEKAKVAK